MHPRAESSGRFGLGVLSAVAGGAVMGWALWPAPAANVAPIPVREAPRKPAPLPASRAASSALLPYDLAALKSPSSRQIAQFASWLAAATCDDVARLLAGQQPDTGFGSHGLLSEMIIRRFGEFPAAERLIALQEHLPEKVTGYDFHVKQAAITLARDLLPAQAAEVSSLLQRFSHLGLYDVKARLGAWVSQDFDAAKAFFESLGKSLSGSFDEGSRHRMTRELFRHLAETDLEAARERAEILPAGEERNEALAGLAAVLAKSDLAGTLKWLAQQGVADDPRRHFGNGPADSLFHSAAMTDPAAAAECVLQNPGLFENLGGPGQVQVLFQVWARTDLTAAREWLTANPLPERFQASAELELTRMELAQAPLESAVAAWQNLPEKQREDLRVIDDIVKRLVTDDPAHALDRIAALLPEDKRAAAMGSVIPGLSVDDRKQILPWLPELTGYFRENPFFIKLLNGLPAEEVQAAMEKLPAEDKRSMQLTLAEDTMSGLDPDPERALASMPEFDPHLKDPFLYSRIAVEMANADPGRAAAWVAGFPEGSSKEWTASNLVATWAKFDPEAAAAWMDRLPAGASRDRSSMELAWLQAVSGDHEAALRVASGVGDEARRADACGYALQNLWRRDPAAAENALATANLSHGQRETVLGKLKSGGYQR